MATMTRTEATAAVLLVAVMAIGAATWWWAAGSGGTSVVPVTPTWPQITRTINGTTTVPMPEDLDR